ncbi:MAG: hypothetical protein KDD92_07760 [Caldilineaceae bacterium]|nr:hypothetical protein [Caldilineaceae bacterium]
MAGKPTAKKHRQRSTLLTVAIILVILHGIFMTVLYYSGMGGSGSSPVALSLMVLASIADVIAGIALWGWKRWGIYLYAAATVLKAVIILIYSLSAITVFGVLVPAIVVLYIITPRLKDFD